MKKTLKLFVFLLLIVFAVAVLVSACATTVVFKIGFDVDGEIIKTIDTNGTEVVKMPEDPVKEGYTFDGWYWDKDSWEKPFTANSLLDAPLSSNMTVYAKWKAKMQGIRVLSSATEYMIGSFSFDDHQIEITYSDGKTTTVPLLSNYISETEYAKTSVVGEQTIAVTYEGLTTSFTIQVLKHSFEGLTFQDKTVTYTGDPVSIEIDNLPDGATVVYDVNNTQTNAGRYEITATISEENYNDKSLSAVLTIEKAKVEKPARNSLSYTYNAESQTYTLPESESYTLTGNVQVNAGTYSVGVALKDKSNYIWQDNSAEDLLYEFVITKAEIAVPAPDNNFFVYSGVEQNYVLVENEAYSISGNKAINAGEYTVTVSLKDKNNYVWETGGTEDKSYVFKIEKSTVSLPAANETIYTYTGAPQTYTLSDSDKYRLTGNIQTLAGDYSVTVSLKDKFNYTWSDGSVADLQYSFSIGKAEVPLPVPDDDYYVYNGQEQSYCLTSTMLYTVENNQATLAGSYPVKVDLADKTNYVWANGSADALYYSFVINKITVAIPAANQKDFIYNGKEQTYTIAENNSYRIFGAAATNAGEYAVSVSLKDKFNYEWSNGSVADLFYSFVIKKASVTGISFENAYFTYDGTAHSLSIDGELPENMTVEYLNNEKMAKGNYNVTAHFINGNPNYNDLADMTALLSISAQIVPIPEADSRTFIYNGSSQTYLLLADDRYEITGSTVATNAGSYDITVSLLDVDNYVWSDTTVSNKTYLFVIGKATYDMSGIDFANGTFVYDEAVHSLLISGALPTGVSVQYDGNGKTMQGEYTVTARFTGDESNYYAIPNKSAILTITREEHTVTFRQSGKPDKEFSVLDLADFTDIPTPIAVTGYEIAWEEANLSRITEDIVVNAVYDLITYTISYTLNDGTNDDRNPATYTVEDDSIILYTPNRDHYDFIGWVLNGKNTSTINTAQPENIIAVASWEKATYSVTYKGSDGETTVRTLSVKYMDAAVFDITTPTKTMSQTTVYTFSKWVDEIGSAEEADLSYIESDRTVYPYYSEAPRRYGITYQVNGGQTIPATTYQYDETKVFSIASRAGYTFEGWYLKENLSGGEVTETVPNSYIDYVLYAKWCANTYTLTFVADDATSGGMSAQNLKTDQVVSLTANAFEREYYSFVGWSLTEGGAVVYGDSANFVMTPNDISLYAVWEAVDYAITYYLNDGVNGNNPSTYTVEDEITLLPATKTAYTFVGWFTEPGFANKVETITLGSHGDLELHASFVLTDYPIIYHLFDGVNAAKNPDTYTVEDEITLKDPSKIGYTFDGWYTNSELTKPITTISNRIGAIDVYAKFVANQYTAVFDGKTCDYMEPLKITFNYNYSGGTIREVLLNIGDTIDIYSSSFIPSRPSSTYLDYIFTGWFYDASCTDMMDDSIYLTNDITLYAGWYYGREMPTSGSIDKWMSTHYYQSGILLGYYTHTLHVDWYVYNWQDGDRRGSASVTDTTTNETIYSESYYSRSSAVDPAQSLTGRGNHVILVALDGYGVSFRISRIRKIVNLTYTTYQSTVTFDETIESPAVSKTGYEFMGWYDENNIRMSKTWGYPSDKTFTAEWELITYPISYQLNGGVNHSSNPSGYTIESNINLCSPSKDGYTFNGWYLDENFTEKIENISNMTGKLTLYAKYTVNTYGLALDAVDGVFAPKVVFLSDGNAIRTEYLFDGDTVEKYYPDAKSGYLFSGWYVDPEFATVFDFNATITDDIVLYAKWIESSYVSVQIESADNSIDLTINGKTEQYICFVPTTNAMVKFTSLSTLDLIGTLYDESRNVLILADDIDNDNLNFSFAYAVEAGKVYYLGIKGSLASANGAAQLEIEWTGTCAISGTTYADKAITYTYGTEYSLPDYVRKEGYHFVGWYDSSNQKYEDGTWNYTRNLSLHAVFDVAV